MVTNGSQSDTVALVEGEVWAGTLVNFGTIEAVGTAYGGKIYTTAVSAGLVVNGSQDNAIAVIKGYVIAHTVANFGTIEAVQPRVGGMFHGDAVKSEGTTTNGSRADTTALIAGQIGVVASGGGQVTNYGTIIGTGGTAVLFKSAGEVLIVEARAVFDGTVVGDGGTLDLAAGGAGSIAGLGSAFTDFGALDVAAGARWRLTGAETIAASTILANGGTLTIAGTLEIGGTVSGQGTLDLAANAVLTADGTVAPGQTADFIGGQGELRIGTPAAFAATIAGFGAAETIDVAGFGSGTKLTYQANGADTGGALTLTSGKLSASIALLGQFAAAGFIAAADGTGGTLVTYTPHPAAPPLAASG